MDDGLLQLDAGQNGGRRPSLGSRLSLENLTRIRRPALPPMPQEAMPPMALPPMPLLPMSMPHGPLTQVPMPHVPMPHVPMLPMAGMPPLPSVPYQLDAGGASFPHEAQPSSTGSRSRRTARTFGTRPTAANTPQDLSVLAGERADSVESLHVRLRIMENELEASRVRLARQRKRIQQLEDESNLSRQALPALETIIKSALVHFDAKESALKHTIAKMHHEMSGLIVEKNEALRLLTSFVGRSARSPPPSFSSMSESGLDGRDGSARDSYARDMRRFGSNSVGSSSLGGAGRRSHLVDMAFVQNEGNDRDGGGDVREQRDGRDASDLARSHVAV